MKIEKTLVSLPPQYGLGNRVKIPDSPAAVIPRHDPRGYRPLASNRLGRHRAEKGGG